MKTLLNFLKMKDKPDHNVLPKTLKILPYLLCNPIATFKSKKDNKMLVLIKAFGKTTMPIVVIIDKNNKEGVNEVNFISSGYEKKENSFKDLIGNLIKIRQKNIPNWLLELINNSILDSVSNKQVGHLKPIKDNNIITNNLNNLNPDIKNYEEKLQIKGSYLPKENLIEFFKNADKSTSVHEVGHWLLETWNKLAPKSKEIFSL